MTKLIMLKGLPASGKSTWAKEQVRKGNGKVKRVNKDELRAMLDDGIWSKSNEHVVLLIRNKIIIEALKEGKDIIVDDTNFSPDHEKVLRKFAMNFNADFEVKFFDTWVEECILRDAKREKPVGEKVIRDMYARYLSHTQRAVDVPSTLRLHDTSLPKTVICDIDGTLAHMDGLRGPYDWHKVGSDSCDVVLRDLLVDLSSAGYTIIVLSGREDICREETEAWLHKHDVPYNFIFMRKADDHRKDSIIKEEIYRTAIEGDFDVRFVLDDRDQVVKMWRGLGLQCFQVAEGNF